MDRPVIRVLIADDHALVRRTIRLLLAHSDGMQVVAEAAGGAEAVQLAADHRPDVLVLDMSMPDMSGAAAAERVLALPQPPAIVVLSMHADTTLVQQLLRRGVRGYVLKEHAARDLPAAVRAVSAGGTFVGVDSAESQ